MEKIQNIIKKREGKKEKKDATCQVFELGRKAHRCQRMMLMPAQQRPSLHHYHHHLSRLAIAACR